MRAWLTEGNGLDALRIADVDIPTPGPTQVLLRVSALSLNYRDLLVIEGVGTWRPDVPVVPISDAVGEVMAVGHKVSQPAPGDRALPVFLLRWIDGDLTVDTCTLPVGGPMNPGMLADFVVLDDLQPVIYSVYAVEQVGGALAHPKSGGHFGKVVVRV